ncbi:MAG: DUF4168 domain-containing protein [Bacteroidales bacterium]|jgi:hypothetical protein|nr:DUF4168 domain-containing protein [Bacteroidales bacterium]
MFTIKKLTSLFLTLIVSSTIVFAQTPQVPQDTDVSDQDLETFAVAFQQVQSLNQTAQQDMVKAVQDEGLSVQRYNEMLQGEKDPAKNANATNQEKEQFEKINQQIAVIQQKAQQTMQQKIQDEGLTVKRYQEIAFAIQNSPELQEKIQQLMQPE